MSTPDEMELDAEQAAHGLADLLAAGQCATLPVPNIAPEISEAVARFVGDTLAHLTRLRPDAQVIRVEGDDIGAPMFDWLYVVYEGDEPDIANLMARDD